MKSLCLAFIVLSLSACTTSVKPWERGTLAKPEMQWVSDPADFALGNHIYFSKEGSTGGALVVGGGCGCN